MITTTRRAIRRHLPFPEAHAHRFSQHSRRDAGDQETRRASVAYASRAGSAPTTARTVQTARFSAATTGEDAEPQSAGRPTPGCGS